MNISSPKRAWARRGEKRAQARSINGSLTVINVENRRAQHAQVNPDDMRTWNFLKPLLFDYIVTNHVLLHKKDTKMYQVIF